MWPWDVCVSDRLTGDDLFTNDTASAVKLTSKAAMCILREAGGMISGGPTQFQHGASDEQVLISRRIVAVRAVAATEVCRPYFSGQSSCTDAEW